MDIGLGSESESGSVPKLSSRAPRRRSTHRCDQEIESRTCLRSGRHPHIQTVGVKAGAVPVERFKDFGVDTLGFVAPLLHPCTRFAQDPTHGLDGSCGPRRRAPAPEGRLGHQNVRNWTGVRASLKGSVSLTWTSSSSVHFGVGVHRHGQRCEAVVESATAGHFDWNFLRTQ